MGNGVLEWDNGSGLREYTWTSGEPYRGELDESVYSFDESGTDSSGYETGSTYEYGDWEDELPYFAEQEENAVTNIAGPSHTASTLQLHNDNDGDNASHPALKALPNDREPTQPVIYALPQILDADDTQEVEDQVSPSPEQATGYTASSP
jgi:hypothetical protein